MQNFNAVQETGRDVLFSKKEAAKILSDMLTSGDWAKGNLSVNATKESLFKALIPMEELEKAFWLKNEKMLKAMSALEDSAKKSTGKARDLHHKTNEALIKLDKSINLDVLDRKVQLLERACDAMERLNALQQTGKLDKILQAIK